MQGRQRWPWAIALSCRRTERIEQLKQQQVVLIELHIDYGVQNLVQGYQLCQRDAKHVHRVSEARYQAQVLD